MGCDKRRWVICWGSDSISFLTCPPHLGPTGTTILPPGARALSSSLGTSSAAAPTWMAWNGGWSCSAPGPGFCSRHCELSDKSQLSNLCAWINIFHCSRGHPRMSDIRALIVFTCRVCSRVLRERALIPATTPFQASATAQAPELVCNLQC